MLKSRTLDDIWLWADATARFVLIWLCFFVGFSAGVGSCGCAPAATARPDLGVREASSSELQSVVTLVAPSVRWREPALSAATFGASTGSAQVSYSPYCNAFAVRVTARDLAPGAMRLITAAHCLARSRLAVGDVARYREPSGWGLGNARVTHVDAGRDYAELEADAGALAPLELGPAPALGAALTTPSALFGEAVSGLAYAQAGGRFAFGGVIAAGWSGSPVIDAQGRAVGVVIKCTTEPGGDCVNGVIAGLL